MFKLIGLLVVLALGFAAGIGWEARPPIGWHLNLLVWHPGFSLPDGWKVQRDRALTAAQDAREATQACRTALGSQNAAIALLGQRSAAAKAQATHDVEAARAVAESLRRSSADLRAYVPKGPDVCAKWTDADRAVKGALQ